MRSAALGKRVRLQRFSLISNIGTDLLLSFGELGFRKQQPSFDLQKLSIAVLNLSPTDTYIRKLQLALTISNQ